MNKICNPQAFWKWKYVIPKHFQSELQTNYQNSDIKILGKIKHILPKWWFDGDESRGTK